MPSHPLSIHAHAKVNIFLKITGHREGYHTLLSRFMRVETLYDTLTFVPQLSPTFTLEGCEGVPLQSNTIYKAYHALLTYTHSPKLKAFFHAHKVVVTKRIPSQAGLGGGSSDAAAFMRLVNQVCQLTLSTERLAEIGSSIGADLPFFLYNYPVANVSGFGEVVTPFEEEVLPLQLFTPPLGCDTTQVYKTFKQHLLATIDPASFAGWEQEASPRLLERITDPLQLNDLYAAATLAYPEITTYHQEGWYFSGSGSTFFRHRS